jgi:hypothetical protein
MARKGCKDRSPKPAAALLGLELEFAPRAFQGPAAFDSLAPLGHERRLDFSFKSQNTRLVAPGVHGSTMDRLPSSGQSRPIATPDLKMTRAGPEKSSGAC